MRALIVDDKGEPQSVILTPFSRRLFLPWLFSRLATFLPRLRASCSPKWTPTCFVRGLRANGSVRLCGGYSWQTPKRTSGRLTATLEKIGDFWCWDVLRSPSDAEVAHVREHKSDGVILLDSVWMGTGRGDSLAEAKSRVEEYMAELMARLPA